MTTFLLALSLYSAILSTILFIRWMRLLILRRNAKRYIEAENLSSEKQAFITEHPLTPLGQVIKDMRDELEGEVVRGFEAELEREESEEVEESIEEREWKEEEMIKQKRQARR